MRSSGSTRSRPAEPPVPLFVRVVGDDHPKACTGRRLLRRGLVRSPTRGPADDRPIVLDPHAARPLSPADRERALRHGVLAVDCSWNRLGRSGGLPALGRGAVGSAAHRRLPLLLAANPQHFGRLAELNTVEALAAAAFLLGRPDQAQQLLQGFRGGPEFLDLNRERLAAYVAATDAAGVRDAERRLFGGDGPA